MSTKSQNSTNTPRTAIYPGTFDPVTNGHLDVLARACALFSKVSIVVAKGGEKNPRFSLAQRMELIQQSIDAAPNKADYQGVSIVPLEGQLTVDFAKAQGACAVVRGLRAVSDFEYEFQMAQMNRQLNSTIETVFLMPSERYFFTSSSLIKQVAPYDIQRLGALIPEPVKAALQA